MSEEAKSVPEDHQLEKPKTVNVHSQLDRPLTLHLHMTVPDDGGGRAFQGRDLESTVTLKPGHNAGINKAFFTTWKEQNPKSLVLQLFNAEDED